MSTESKIKHPGFLITGYMTSLGDAIIHPTREEANIALFKEMEGNAELLVGTVTKYYLNPTFNLPTLIKGKMYALQGDIELEKVKAVFKKEHIEHTGWGVGVLICEESLRDLRKFTHG